MPTMRKTLVTGGFSVWFREPVFRPEGRST